MHLPFAEVSISLIGSPLVNAVVMVNVAADAGSKPAGAGLRWERILERGWAVIVVDAGASLVLTGGIVAMLSQSPAGIFTGMASLLLTATLVYAEPYICAQENVSALMLIPASLFRSMSLAWVNLSRIFALFALTLIASMGDILLEELARNAGLHHAVWVDFFYDAPASAVLAAIFTIAYLDTLSLEAHQAS